MSVKNILSCANSTFLLCDSKTTLHVLPYVRLCNNQNHTIGKIQQPNVEASSSCMDGAQGEGTWQPPPPVLGSGAQQQQSHQQAAGKLRAWEEKQLRKQEKAAQHERMARQQRNRVSQTRQLHLRAQEHYVSQSQPPPLPPPQLPAPPPELAPPLPEQQAVPTSSVLQQQQAEQTAQPNRKHSAPPSGRTLRVLPAICKPRKPSKTQGKDRQLKHSQPKAAAARASLPAQRFVEHDDGGETAAVIAPHSLIPIFWCINLKLR